MYQKIVIVGRLGRDVELRYTPQGQAVANMSVATDKSWVDASGTKKEQTTWFKVSVWGKQAEACNQHLSKGRTVLVEGEMQEPKPYQKRDGTWACSLDLRAMNVRFLGKGDETHEAKPSTPAGDDDEELIPF